MVALDRPAEAVSDPRAGDDLAARHVQLARALTPAVLPLALEHLPIRVRELAKAMAAAVLPLAVVHVCGGQVWGHTKKEWKARARHRSITTVGTHCGATASPKVRAR